MKEEFKLIESLEQLKVEAEDFAEFLIQLKGGLVSRKVIRWDEDDKKFWILNCIDDTEQCLTEKQIINNEHTLIGEAIEKKAFYKDLR
jgi:hypothetical protein